MMTRNWNNLANEIFDDEAAAIKEKLADTVDAKNNQVVKTDTEKVEIKNEQVEVVRNVVDQSVKIDDRSVYVFFDEESGKASFKGRFLTAHRKDNSYKLIGQVGVPKNVFKKVNAIATDSELTMVEIINLLLVDLAENGCIKKDLLKRYRKQV